MSVMSVNLHGFAELQKRLESLAKEEATKAGQSANRVGAVVLKKKIETTAPKSGVTEGSISKRKTKGGAVREEAHRKIVNWIKVKKTRNESPTKVQNSVTASKAYQASFVEFGSIHNAPNPFMKRALDTSQQDIIDAMAKALNKQLIRRGA